VRVESRERGRTWQGVTKSITYTLWTKVTRGPLALRDERMLLYAPLCWALADVDWLPAHICDVPDIKLRVTEDTRGINNPHIRTRHRATAPDMVTIWGAWVADGREAPDARANRRRRRCAWHGGVITHLGQSLAGSVFGATIAIELTTTSLSLV
jgi:hypothetical protein